MQHLTKLKEVLEEVDLTDYPGEITNKYVPLLSSLVNSENFIEIFEENFEFAATNKNLRRLNFLILLIIQFGDDSKSYQRTYLRMMDFFLVEGNHVEPSQQSGVENLLSLVLDLFWHQDNPLRNLDADNQWKLSHFLAFVSKYRYEVNDFDDEIFFAINKSMDLIKYQKTFGDSPALIRSFLNHFDERVSRRAREYHGKG